jgi:hypothetical protein
MHVFPAQHVEARNQFFWERSWTALVLKTENAESLKMGLPLTKKNGLVLAKTFKISRCELWVLIYTVNFQSMLRMTFIGVSAGESHMFLTFPAAFDPYQKQIFPAQRSSKLCSKVDTSYTKTFGEQKSARRT